MSIAGHGSPSSSPWVAFPSAQAIGLSHGGGPGQWIFPIHAAAAALAAFRTYADSACANRADRPKFRLLFVMSNRGRPILRYSMMRVSRPPRSMGVVGPYSAPGGTRPLEGAPRSARSLLSDLRAANQRRGSLTSWRDENPWTMGAASTMTNVTYYRPSEEASSARAAE